MRISNRNKNMTACDTNPFDVIEVKVGFLAAKIIYLFTNLQ